MGKMIFYYCLNFFVACELMQLLSLATLRSKIRIRLQMTYKINTSHLHFPRPTFFQSLLNTLVGFVGFFPIFVFKNKRILQYKVILRFKMTLFLELVSFYIISKYLISVIFLFMCRECQCPDNLELHSGHWHTQINI